MKRFALGQRVLVHATDGGGPMRPTLGVVRRIRHADDAAWIELDERGEEQHHPFPADDTRARHVLALPEWCDGVAKGGAS